ncbi:MAG: M20/M25/M40 family metallo-hydrolase [Armatimonadota bacterium]
MIDKQRLLDSFLELADINSPSGDEAEIASNLKMKLESLGFDVLIDDAGPKANSNSGNLIARKSGSLPDAQPILFSAHMDTVSPTTGLICAVIDGCVCSGGDTILGADDKAGIAAILEALKVVEDDNIPHGDIEIVFSICEEIGLVGIRHLEMSQIKSRCCFVFDIGKPVGSVTTAAPTQDNLKIQVKGKAAHAGANPEDGINAIVAASKAISGMKIGRIDSETTANVGIINGGCATNIVPESVEILGEARSRDRDKLTAQVEHMKAVLDQTAGETGAQITMEISRSYNGYRLSPDTCVVQIAIEAARRAGIEPELHETGGGSDANILNERAIPAVPIGVGYDKPHCCDEIMPIDDLVRCAAMALEIIKIAAESR